jgi:hypothetical protein
LKDLEAEYEAKKAKVERNFEDVRWVVEQYSHEEILQWSCTSCTIPRIKSSLSASSITSTKIWWAKNKF